MTMTDDPTEIERWDGDPNDSSQYCQHGTFIGSWWGPDYMCGWCEDGYTLAEMRAALRADAERRLADRADRYDILVASLEESTATGAIPSARRLALLRLVVDLVWEEHV